MPAAAKDVAALILDALQGTPRKARFLSEVAFAAAQRGIGGRDLELALRELEGQGVLLVRDHYCADPHLEGVDLRVVGLVAATPGLDALSQAVESIEAVWQEWLRAFLAEHRCC